MSEFVFMLKMDGCGHCTATLENAKQLKDEEGGGRGKGKGKGKKRRFFHANTEKYHFLCDNYAIEDELRTFLDNKTSKQTVLDVDAFPTLFLVSSRDGSILSTTVGAPRMDALKRLMDAAQ